jgi:hypothetical protein
MIKTSEAFSQKKTAAPRPRLPPQAWFTCWLRRAWRQLQEQQLVQQEQPQEQQLQLQVRVQLQVLLQEQRRYLHLAFGRRRSKPLPLPMSSIQKFFS